MTSAPIANVNGIANALDPNATAAPDAQSGATPFAQFLNKFATPLASDAANAGAPAAASSVETVDEAASPDSTTTPAGDAALIVALLEQMQAPYTRAATPAANHDSGDTAAGESTPAAHSPLASTAPAVAQAPAMSNALEVSGDPATPDLAQTVAPGFVAKLPPREIASAEANVAASANIPSAPLGTPRAHPLPDATPTSPGVALSQAVTADTANPAIPPALEVAQKNSLPAGETPSAPRADDRAVVTPGTNAFSRPAAPAHAARELSTGTPVNPASAQTLTQAAATAAEALNLELAAYAATQSAAQPTATRARVAQTQPLVDAANSSTSIAGFGYAATPIDATVNTAPAPNVPLAPRLDTPEWKPAFAHGVRSLVQDGMSSASLQLNPAELGPVDVRIVMTEQRADISFVVRSAEANQAIQSALPDLREQLARSGIELGQASVGGQRSDTREEPRRQPTARGSAPDTIADVTAASTAPRARALGQIDTFA